MNCEYEYVANSPGGSSYKQMNFLPTPNVVDNSLDTDYVNSDNTRIVQEVESPFRNITNTYDQQQK